MVATVSSSSAASTIPRKSGAGSSPSLPLLTPRGRLGNFSFLTPMAQNCGGGQARHNPRPSASTIPALPPAPALPTSPGLRETSMGAFIFPGQGSQSVGMGARPPGRATSPATCSRRWTRRSARSCSGPSADQPEQLLAERLVHLLEQVAGEVARPGERHTHSDRLAPLPGKDERAHRRLPQARAGRQGRRGAQAGDGRGAGARVVTGLSATAILRSLRRSGAETEISGGRAE